MKRGTGAVGRLRRDGDELVVERVELSDDTLRTFGDPIATFDWIVRAHALDQKVPLPVAEDAARMLEAAPLTVFSLARSLELTLDVLGNGSCTGSA